MEKKLPELTEIIYRLEDFHSKNNVWLDITEGKIIELAPEILEAKPELLGDSIFPLPDWSSGQGYELMQKFASRYQYDNELHKILRSRHQVFKRYRNYLKLYPELKQAWHDFKEQYFFQYLQSWYACEFPKARGLQKALQGLNCSLHSAIEGRDGNLKNYLGLLEEETEASLVESLLPEDFEFCETIGETAAMFSQLSITEIELRTFALFHFSDEYHILSGSHFKRLHSLCNNVFWLNRIDLVSPAGDCIASLYWAWHKAMQPKCQPEGHNQARLIMCISNKEYTQLKLENHLLSYFLSQRQKYGIQIVELHLSCAAEKFYTETLLEYQLEQKGRICHISFSSEKIR